MFVDASALCAILLREPEGAGFRLKLETALGALTSHMAVFETVRAVLRKKDGDFTAARNLVIEFLAASRIELIDLNGVVGEAALEALDRFGKGRHPAKLNMGDCFAYGCAKANGLPMLFKGEDFSQTDIAAA